MEAIVVDMARNVVTQRFTRAGAWERQKNADWLTSRILTTNRFVINPEWEPGHDDDHQSGEVDGDDVVADLPGEEKVHLQAAVLPSHQN